jgi:excisionase family DNA binding protein
VAGGFLRVKTLGRYFDQAISLIGKVELSPRNFAKPVISAGFSWVAIVRLPDIKGDMEMAKMIDLDTHLSPEQAAKVIGASPDTIRRYCNRGVIKAIKAGSALLIPIEECERFKTQRRGKGRPAN